MAIGIRPVFLPTPATDKDLFLEKEIEFTWHMGTSYAQRRKCVLSLHEEIKKEGINSVLEISTKSDESVGRSLSAFNLRQKETKEKYTVESLYQGSKVFEKGGPFTDIFSSSSRNIKKDPRLHDSGELIAFNFEDRRWPLEPPLFYDWLYISILCQNEDLCSGIVDFEGFTDIAFNPKKSFNCQARSVAIFVSLMKRGHQVDKLLDVDVLRNLLHKETTKEPPFQTKFRLS